MEMDNPCLKVNILSIGLMDHTCNETPSVLESSDLQTVEGEDQVVAYGDCLFGPHE